MMEVTKASTDEQQARVTVTSSDLIADTARWFGAARKGTVTIVDDRTGDAKLTLTIPQSPDDVAMGVATTKD